MPLNPPETWLDRIVTAVPGLAALAYGFTLPADVRVLFDAVLAILVFAGMAIVLHSRPAIKRWPKRRVTGSVAGLAAGAIVSFVLYFSAETSIVRAYDPYPPERDTTVVQLLPTRLHLAPPSFSFPYLDCREAMGSGCDQPVLREARSADEVVGLLVTHGTFDVKLPSGGASQLGSLTVLLTLFSLTAVQLVALFGIVRMRGITPAKIAQTFAPSAD